MAWNIFDPLGIAAASDKRRQNNTSYRPAGGPRGQAATANNDVWDWGKYRIGGAAREDSFTGMKDGFRGSLQSMVEGMPPHIREKFQITSGYRSKETQARLYADQLKKNNGDHAKTRREVAPSGKSQHGFGNAADLKYADDEVKQWAHANAEQYGMHFPMSWEPWHIEAKGSRGGEAAYDPKRDGSASDKTNTGQVSGLPGIARELGETAGEARKIALNGGYDPKMNTAAEYKNKLPNQGSGLSGVPENVGAGPVPVLNGFKGLSGVPSNVGAPPGPKGPIMPDGKPVPNPAVATPAAAEPGPKGETAPPSGPGGLRGLGDQLANALFPNQEDPRAAMGKAMSALGVGFGQMAQGQGVDLQPYFNNIADNKAAGVAAAAKQEQQKFDNNIALRGAANDEARVELERGRLAQTVSEDLGYPTPPDMLARMEADPRAAPYVEMVKSNDKALRKEGYTGWSNLVAADLEEEMVDNADLGGLHRLIATGAEPMEVSQYLTDNPGLDSSDLQRVTTALGKDPTAYMQNAEAWLEADDEEREGMMDFALAQAGLSERKQDTRRYDRVRSKVDGAIARNATNYEINGYLDMMEEGILQAAKTGSPEGSIAEAIYSPIADFASGFLGSDKGAEWAAENNIDLNAIQKQGVATQALAMLIARPMMKGQGTVTDGERKMILRMLSNPGQTAATRLQLINRVKAMNKVDELYMQKGVKLMSEKDGYKRFEASDAGWQASARQAAQSIGLSAMTSSGDKYKGQGPEGKDFTGFDSATPTTAAGWQKKHDLTPKLSQQTYDMYGSAIESTIIGTGAEAKEYRKWIRLNGDGTRSYMLNDEVVDFGVTQ